MLHVSNVMVFFFNSFPSLVELAVRGIMTETVKIFGERNTATNALRQLIQMNSQSKLSPGTLGELYPVRAEVLGDYGGLASPARLRSDTQTLCLQAIHP